MATRDDPPPKADTATLPMASPDAAPDENATIVQTSLPGSFDPALPVVPGYEVIEEIARGGMGVVYAARDLVLGREVAIKTLLPHLANDPRLASHFDRETRIAACLPHPGIAPVHTLGTLPDGRPFLVMKLVRGRTLAELLLAKEAAGLLAVFEQIAHTVGFAHSQGVIHRDLKPANVMVGVFGEVQVMDWGLARSRANHERERGGGPISGARDASETVAGSAKGTPAYMPPEQARGEWDTVDARADVFSLGGILCEMLTGSPPYPGGNVSEVLRKAKAAELAETLVRLDRCAADPEVVALAKLCLAPDPADRPADGKAVAQAVAAYRGRVEERAHRAEAERAAAEAEAREQKKRRRVQLALALAVLALIALAAAGAWWNEKTKGERKAEQAAFDREREVRAEEARTQARNLVALAAELRNQYRFGEAENALIQAGQLAAAGDDPALVEAVKQAKFDLEFVRELDAIRMKRSTWVPDPIGGGSGQFDLAGAPGAYRAAFAGRGWDLVSDPVSTGERVAASAVRAGLVSALDDWAILEPESAIREKVLAALRRADPDSGAAPFRDPAVWNDAKRLRGLAAAADLPRMSPGAIVAVAEVLEQQHINSAELLRRALALHPREFLLAFGLGKALLWRDSFEAVGAYRTARAIRPDNTSVLVNLGNVLEKHGDLAGALASYREALRIDPSFAIAHYSLGYTLHRYGSVYGAMVCYGQALRAAPHFAKAHINLGVALGDLGDPAAEIAAYREAIRSDPKAAMAYYNLGNIYQRQPGQLDAAIAAYEAAIHAEPEFARAHNNLGLALLDKGKEAEAIASWRRALQHDPTFAMAHCNLGAALFQQKKYQEALAEAREAIRYDPAYPYSHALLGYTLQKLGDIPGARSAWTEAARLAPKKFGYLLLRLPPVPVAPPPRLIGK